MIDKALHVLEFLLLALVLVLEAKNYARTYNAESELKQTAARLEREQAETEARCQRIADTCIGLFNLKELHPLPKNQEEEKAAKKLLQDLGVATYAPGDKLEPIDGKVFARLMKRRYGYYPLDIVLDWEGRTKYFKPNVPGYAPDDEPGWLKRAIEEEDDKDIF